MMHFNIIIASVSKQVNLECWHESAELMAWMRREKLPSTTALFQLFESRLFDVVAGLGKVPVVWQGVIDANALPKNFSRGTEYRLTSCHIACS